MLWLKRNILLVVSAMGALALLGVAITYLLSEYGVYNSYDESIKQLKDGIRTLGEYNPTPNEANIAVIKNNGVVLKKFMDEAEGLFVAITNQNLTSGPFKILLDKTIAELTREATNSGITLPLRYKFTFGELQSEAVIPPTIIGDLTVQVEEIRTLALVLFESRISSLLTIQRTQVRGERTSSGAEFLTDRAVVTNHYGIVAPYVVSFKCFTPELSAVLNKLATHRYFLVARKVEVQSSEGGIGTGAPVPKGDDLMAPPPGFMAGIPGGAMPRPPGAQPPPAKGTKGPPVAPKSNLVKQLDEKPLLVTMRIDFIKPYKGARPGPIAAAPRAPDPNMPGDNGQPPPMPPPGSGAKGKQTKATTPSEDFQ